MTKNKIIGLIVLVLLVVIGIIILKSPKESNNNIKKVDEDKIAIMVFDKNQNKYVEQNTNSFPMGAYKLNTEFSHCANGSPLGTYDPKTGTMTSEFNKTDKCYYYFDIGKLTPTLTLPSDAGLRGGYVSGLGQEVASFTYDGDGIVTCIDDYYGSSIGCTIKDSKVYYNDGNCNNYAILTISASSTDTYESVSAAFTVRDTCLYSDTLIDYYDRKKKKKLKKRIKDIEVGDEVYTYNPETGMTELKKVKKVTTCKVKEAVVLTIKGEELIIAKGHPVYVDGIGMLEVSLVKENYKLIGNDGIVYTVDKVEIRNFAEEQTMYNLLLDGGGNIIIGKIGILCLSLVMISLTGIKEVSAACSSTC